MTSDRQPGDLPCPATGEAHAVTATPHHARSGEGLWENVCDECGDQWLTPMGLHVAPVHIECHDD